MVTHANKSTKKYMKKLNINKTKAQLFKGILNFILIVDKQ